MTAKKKHMVAYMYVILSRTSVFKKVLISDLAQLLSR